MKNISKEEPNPISQQSELVNSFKYECNTAIIEMIHSMYSNKKFTVDVAKKELLALTNQSSEEIDSLLAKWDEMNNLNFDLH